MQSFVTSLVTKHGKFTQETPLKEKKKEKQKEA